MRFLSILLPLLSLFPFSLPEPTIQTTSTPSRQKATIHYHVLAPNILPSPLAELTYVSSPSFEVPQSPTVDSFTPPAAAAAAGGNATTKTTQELVQIGIYDKSIGGLRAPTSVLSTSAFSQAGQGHFRIHLAPDGESVWSVSYHNIPSTTSSGTAEANGKGKAKEKEKGRAKALPTFEIVYPKQGPRPVLNQPVALTKEGKVLGKEDVDERGFIQK